MKENLDQNERAAGRLGSATYYNFASSIFDLEGTGHEERLISAVKENDLQKVEEILNQKNDSLVDINVRDPERGNTPLLWATIRGHSKMVQVLLQHGADVTLRNFEGQTAVEVASPQIRQKLLEAVDKGGTQRNLLQAAWQGNAMVMRKSLEDPSVDIDCRNSEGLTPLLLVTRDLQLFEKFGDRLSQNSNPAETLKELLTHRANTNVQDPDGKTCLHYVSSTKASQAAKLVKQLINSNCIVNCGDKNSFSPLHCASQSGNTEVALALLHGGADSNARSSCGTTPLHISALHGHDIIATTLLKFGADITLVDNNGYTPFHVAKTKTVKNVLRQAWTEATQAKIEKNLHPIRNEMGKMEGLAPPVKGGQVIFDSMPNSLANFDALTPRRAAISVLQRQSTNAERARRAEEQRLREINQGIFGHTALNNRVQTLQKTGRKSEKLESRGNEAGGRQSATRRAGETRLPYMREHQIPVTVLGSDMEETGHEIRMKRLRPNQQLKNQGHFRNNSDPTESNRGELECDDAFQRGRSQSKASSLSDDVDEMSQFTSVSTMSCLSQTRITPPVQTPSLFERGKTPRQEDRRAMVLDLDRMQLTNHSRTPVQGEPLYPHSRSLLPPTPMLNYGYSYQGDTTEVTSDVSNPSSKENSPRTSFESDDLEEADEDNLEEENKKTVSRPRTILRQGSFHIEDTQVQNSSDSGFPEKGSGKGSNRSSVASSNNSSLAGTPDGAGETSRNVVSVGLGGKKMVSMIMDKFRGKKVSDDAAQVKVIKVGSKNGSSLHHASHFGTAGQSQDQSKVTEGSTWSNNLQKHERSVPQPVIINITSASEVDATIAANANKTKTSQDTSNGRTDNVAETIVEEMTPSGRLSTDLQDVDARQTKSDVFMHKTKTTVITVTAKTPNIKTEDGENKGALQSSSVNLSSKENAVSTTSTAKPNRPPPPNKKPKALPRTKLANKVTSNCTSSCNTNQTKPSRPPPPTSDCKSGVQAVSISRALNVEVRRGPCSNAGGTSKGSDKPVRPPPPDKDKLNASQEMAKAIAKSTTACTATSNSTSNFLAKSCNTSSTLTTAAGISNFSKSTSAIPATSTATASNFLAKPNASTATAAAATTVSNIQAKTNTLMTAATATAANFLAKSSTSSTDTVSNTSQSKTGATSQTPTHGKVSKQGFGDKKSVVTLHYSSAKKNQWPRRTSKSTFVQNAQTASNSPTRKNSDTTTKEVEKMVETINNQAVSSEQVGEADPNSQVNSPMKQASNNKDINMKAEKIATEPKRSSPTVNSSLQAKVNMIEGSLQANSGTKTPTNGSKPTSRPSSKTSIKGGAKSRRISDYTGPVIRDAFEGFKVPEEKTNAVTRPLTRVKSAKIKRKVGERPLSSKKTTKAKKEKKVQPAQPVDAVRVVKGVKGRKKSAKKGLKDNLRISNRTDAVAFISGQGWHIETDAVADVVMAEDSSSDEEESVVQLVVPGALSTLESDDGIHRLQISRQKEKRPSQTLLPGALVTSESEHHTDQEEVNPDVKDSEEVLDEVVFRNNTSSVNSELRRQSLNSTFVITPRGISEECGDNGEEADIDDNDEKDDIEEIHDDDNKMKPIWAAEMKIRAHSPTNLQAAAPNTAKIINNFARSTCQNPDGDSQADGNSTDASSSKRSVTKKRQKSPRMLNVQPYNDAENNGNSSDDCDTRSRPLTRGSKSRSTSRSLSSQRSISRSPSGQRSPKRSPGSSPSRIPRLTLTSPNKNLNIRTEKVTKTLSPKHQPSSPKLNGYKISGVTENSSNTECPRTRSKFQTNGTKTPRSSQSKSKESARKSTTGNFSKKDDVVFEPDVDEAINEILKNTPSLTMSLKSGKSSSEETGNGCTLDDLRNSWGSMTFRELPVINPQSPQGPRQDNNVIQPDQAILDQLAEEFDVSAAEKAQFSKIMNSLRNMELTVSVTDSVKEDRMNSSTRKPPVPPRPSKDVGAQKLERSPRFVRKADSFRGEQAGTSSAKGEESSESDVEFGSDILEFTSSTVNDDNNIKTEERVVTSRLGRVSSAMTNDSNTEDNDTIHWKRGNMLGKGAFGTVWCGLTNAGGLIAVKQIELNINDMDKAEAEYEKIQQEVEILKTLNHRNIVSYLGTSLEENIVSIFMQFVPGGSIANILARFGALQEQVMRHYTKQIVEGVEYLHANDVIHRDVKGGNIMVMQDGVIKLIDFGCAKRLCLNVNVLVGGNNRLLKSMRGTPYWMSPEVVKETGYGTKSDIWSIGCTVFEMATRKPPWSDRDPMAAIFAIGSDKPVPQLPNTFSSEARDFVKFCLTRDQSKRPSASELLEHPFMRKRRR